MVLLLTVMTMDAFGSARFQKCTWGKSQVVFLLAAISCPVQFL